VTARAGATEGLLVEALRQECGETVPSPLLLIGVQACATIDAINQCAGARNVALLHVDRAAGGVGCGFGNAEAYLSGEMTPADGARFGVVGLNVEAAKNYRLLREIVAALPGYLGAGGVALVAGPRRGGADVAATALRAGFDTVTLLAYRKGHRVYRATGLRQPSMEPMMTGPTATASPDAAWLSSERVSLRGHEIHLLQDDRIFARGRLDPATAMLAGCVAVPPAADVLDLGCGGGVLGILAALLEPTSRVTLADADPLAVEASRRNAALNGVENVSVHLSDVLADLPGRTFDLVLMNPPFHQGRTQDVGIAHRFIAEAGAALRPGGTLYVVCNRFLRYEPVIAQHVGPAREVAGDPRYKVLVAQRPD
jgi:16S rRNA (guanine1207-N2)-methyltransferase